MNVAYFSTVETTISSSSYSLLTSSGRLLMIDISFLLVIYLLPLTRAKNVVKGTHIPFLGLERPHDSLGSRRLPKVGSLQPNSVFFPRPKLTAAPCATSTLPLTSVHHSGERNDERGGDLCLSCTVHRHCGLQKQASNGLAQDRYRRTRFYRESVVRILSADRPLLALRYAMLRTGSRTAPREIAAGHRSGTQNPRLPARHTRGCPTSCEPGSSGGLHWTRPIQAASLLRHGSGPQPSENGRPLVRCTESEKSLAVETAPDMHSRVR